MLSRLLGWIPLAIAVTGLAVLGYGVGQQVLRQSLNDPQVEMAETGKVPGERVDMAESLKPFVIFFDGEGRISSSSGWLHGRVPVPPAGVFKYTERAGRDQFTWQPEDDVRIAAVMQKQNNGFILAGRNMREVEAREQKLLLEVGQVGQQQLRQH